MNKLKQVFLSFICILALLPSKAGIEHNIIACVNHKPIYNSEFNRLFKVRLRQFEKQHLFDPWEASSLNDLEARYELIEKAKNKNISLNPQDVLAYKNQFQQKAQKFGSAINTYDLNSYAEENALLLQFFQQEAFKTIQDNLIEKALIMEEAQRNNLQVQNWEVENRLAEIKSKYKNEENFQTFLRNNNATELELKASLEEQIAVEKLKNKNNQNFEEWFNKIKENSLIEFATSEADKKSLSCAPKLAEDKTQDIKITNNNINTEKNKYKWFKWKHRSN